MSRFAVHTGFDHYPYGVKNCAFFFFGFFTLITSNTNPRDVLCFMKRRFVFLTFLGNTVKM